MTANTDRQEPLRDAPIPADFIPNLRKEVMLSAMKTTFTFSRDEVIALLATPPPCGGEAELVERAGEILFKDWRRDERSEGGPTEHWREQIRKVIALASTPAPAPVAWRAVANKGGRSPQLSWCPTPVSAWALADEAEGVCTIEYAYKAAAPAGQAVTDAMAELIAADCAYDAERAKARSSARNLARTAKRRAEALAALTPPAGEGTASGAAAGGEGQS